MYLRHFGFRGEPFSLTPDPDFLFLSRGHAEAAAALEIGLRSHRGLIVMTGEVGTGKTTLLYSLSQRLGSEIHLAYVSNTKLPFGDILRQLISDFGLPDEGADLGALYRTLNQFLLRCGSEGTTAAVVIDEAHNLDDDAFERLRLLSNFETLTTKLLQIVLAGQPELDVRLSSPALRQVADRVAVRCHVNPLTSHEARRYIEHRLSRAGGSAALFTRPAMRSVLRLSRGIPRRMNILCDNALLFAYGRGQRRVTRSCVRAAIRSHQGRGLVTLAPQASAAPAWPESGVGHRPRSLLAAAAGAFAGACIVIAVTPGLRSPASLRRADDRASQEPARQGSGDASAEIARRAADAPDDGVHEVVPPVSAGDASEPPGASALPEDAARLARRSDPAHPDSVDGSMAPRLSEGEPPSLPAGVRLVRVAAGQSLASLARRIYGDVDPQLIRRIQIANPQIVDPNHILVGDTLRFPDTPQPESEDHE